MIPSSPTLKAVAICDHSNTPFAKPSTFRRSTSFRLQTATDWFYPDFICLLSDGRILVFEYNGTHLVTAADATE